MKPYKADLMILAVTMTWGSSYLFMKIGLETVSSFTLVALRFGLAFLICAAVFFRQFRTINLVTLKYGFILGFLLFSVSASVILGLKTTSASNAGFLASLTVIFIPLLSIVLFKENLNYRQIISAFFAITGIGLLTLKDHFTINPGDLLCVLAAILYAFHIIVTGIAAKVANTLHLGILQLGFAGGFGVLFTLIFEKPQLPASKESWLAVLVLSIVCSAFGYILQSIAQKYTTPAHTGIIFSLEPVFAALFAYFFMNELLPLKGYLGAFLILTGVFIAELKIKIPHHKNTIRTEVKKCSELT
ncbi:DMT family transporter [Bacillus sp. 03113]|uniref:DMT family transporter n=1 Tax=Bacillus sp. 03113 TaxID=2578211 RepID=UPI0011444D90|nr:DMT family transporter [Bacillus sp. 03113]